MCNGWDRRWQEWRRQEYGAAARKLQAKFLLAEHIALGHALGHE
jgi:hypothetical protein